MQNQPKRDPKQRQNGPIPHPKRPLKPLFQTSQTALNPSPECGPSAQRGSRAKRRVRSDGGPFWCRPTVAGLSLRRREAWEGELSGMSQGGRHLGIFAYPSSWPGPPAADCSATQRRASDRANARTSATKAACTSSAPSAEAAGWRRAFAAYEGT